MTATVLNGVPLPVQRARCVVWARVAKRRIRGGSALEAAALAALLPAVR